MESHPIYDHPGQGIAPQAMHATHNRFHSQLSVGAAKHRKRSRPDARLHGVMAASDTDPEVKGVLHKIFICVNASLGLCAVDESLLEEEVEEVAEAASSSSAPFWCQVRTFGSRALNANLPGGDLDVIVLTPLDAHFDLFGTFASESIPRVGGKVLCKVRSARVPVLKLSLDGFDIDLLSVPVNSDEPLSDRQIRSPDVFDKVPPQFHTSLNGIRTVLEIKNVISGRWRMFGSILRRIKIWAKARHVYGTNFTFPGGVGFAVMVAKAFVQVVSREADEEFYLRNFFMYFSAYFSDTSKTGSKEERLSAGDPIFIPPSKRLSRNAESTKSATPSTSLEAWNPEANEDLFVVLNPATPHVNTCRGMSKTALECFCSEIFRAKKLIELAEFQEAMRNPTDPSAIQKGLNLALSNIFRPLTSDPQLFLANWTHAILVEVPPYFSSSVADHEEWDRYIESKFRYLIYSLEGRLLTALSTDRYPNVPLAKLRICCRTGKPTVQQATGANESGLEDGNERIPFYFAIFLHFRDTAAESHFRGQVLPVVAQDFMSALTLDSVDVVNAKLGLGVSFCPPTVQLCESCSILPLFFPPEPAPPSQSTAAIPPSIAGSPRPDRACEHEAED